MLGKPWGALRDFPDSPSGKEAACQGRRHKRCRSNLGLEDPLEEGMAIHSSFLAWKIPRTEEPGGLLSMESQKSWTRLSDKTTGCSEDFCLQQEFKTGREEGWGWGVAGAGALSWGWIPAEVTVCWRLTSDSQWRRKRHLSVSNWTLGEKRKIIPKSKRAKTNQQKNGNNEICRSQKQSKLYEKMIKCTGD